VSRVRGVRDGRRARGPLKAHWRHPQFMRDCSPMGCSLGHKTHRHTTTEHRRPLAEGGGNPVRGVMVVQVQEGWFDWYWPHCAVIDLTVNTRQGSAQRLRVLSSPMGYALPTSILDWASDRIEGWASCRTRQEHHVKVSLEMRVPSTFCKFEALRQEFFSLSLYQCSWYNRQELEYTNPSECKVLNCTSTAIL